MACPKTKGEHRRFIPNFEISNFKKPALESLSHQPQKKKKKPVSSARHELESAMHSYRAGPFQDLSIWIWTGEHV